MVHVDASVHPLTALMLGQYVSSCEDLTNFPKDEVSTILDRYEVLFANILIALSLTKEQLRKRSEFNFSSCNAANLEGGIAILRVVEALRLRGFTELSLVAPAKGQQGADLTATFAGIKVCVEVKTVTKQSRGREELFFEDQLYEKVREHATKASKQLAISAEQLKCEVKLIAYVVNWFAQSIYLMESDYQKIVNKLEKHGEMESLDGVDGVLFITKMGQEFLLLNDAGKRIDVAPKS